MGGVSPQVEKWLESLTVGIALFLNPDKGKTFFKGLVMDNDVVRRQCQHRHRSSKTAYECGDKLLANHRRSVRRKERSFYY